MASARTTRLGQEILAASPESAGVTRQGIQVAVSKPGANSAATASVTRLAHEVLAETPDTVAVTRQGVQVAVSKPGANSAAIASVTRLAHEVLAEAEPRAAVTRQGIQVAFGKPGANLAAAANVTRYGFEILARSFIPMTEFDIPANFELFLHNWATACRLESTYRTDVTSAAESLAEERTGLIQKPYRALTVEWTARQKAEINTLLVELRRLVDETSIVPLYCDAVELTASASAGASTVYGDFSRGRWFQNGPVVIVRLTPTQGSGGASRVQSWEFGTIVSRFDDRLKLADAIATSSPAARTVVMPLMKTHPQTAVTFTHETNTMAVLSVTFDEVYGPTALPPVASDLPGGFYTYSGLPILSPLGHQWANGLEVEFVREGELSSIGRGRLVFQRGARHRVSYELRFEDYRAGIWPMIQFFDTRRGRLIPFWMIDPENVFTVSLISGSFLTVSVLGDLSDFQAEMDHVGIVFTDGRTAVRRATAIQLVAGAWRITLDEALPAGYTASDIRLFGRARKMRMREDALAEDWDTTNVCRLAVPVIELLAEGEVTP